MEAMKAEAVPMGERVLAEEIALDRLFASGAITGESLQAAMGRIGAAQGALRATHLRYHLAMKHLLSPEQIASYRKLRGYMGHHDQETK